MNELDLVKSALEGSQTAWEEIVRSAWLGGDPGLLFLDAIGRLNSTPLTSMPGRRWPACG